MFQHTLETLTESERLAAEGRPLDVVLAQLRRLSLDEFNQFMIDLPNVAYPGLSAMLPRMASSDIQTKWTGSSGNELLVQTVAFVRILENSYVRHQGKPLDGARILDFGCGYGRILRAMYYYSAPKTLWGVDAWDKSLDICRQDGILGNLALSDSVPDSLPVGDEQFDLVYAFSVFTHLAPEASKACLKAIRKCIEPDGLLVVTVRPVEFWEYIDQVRGTNEAKRLIEEHASSGFAYLPQDGEVGKTYGDISIDWDLFQGSDWQVMGYDWTFIDPYQVALKLRPI